MKFKYLSSDFLASYNEVYDELEKKQKELDKEYEFKVEALAERERQRLELLVPIEYATGETVRVQGSNKTGKVVDSRIEFDVIAREDTDSYGNPFYGPDRLYPIKSARDEEVVTCEGMLRVYRIAMAPNILEEDWGHEEIVRTYYSDQIEKIG